MLSHRRTVQWFDRPSLLRPALYERVVRSILPVERIRLLRPALSFLALTPSFQVRVSL